MDSRNGIPRGFSDIALPGRLSVIAPSRLTAGFCLPNSTWPYTMRNRSHQREKAGCYTDVDGYKKARNAPGPHPTTAHWPPLSRLQQYPCEDERALMTKAIKKRWNVTEDMKDAILDNMQAVMEEGDFTDKVGAARVMMAAEKQNQDDKLRRHGRRDKIAINTILQLAEPTMPDPEYLEWKRKQLMNDKPIEGSVENTAITVVPSDDDTHDDRGHQCQWTGEGGDTDMSNPDNWLDGRVPETSSGVSFGLAVAPDDSCQSVAPHQREAAARRSAVKARD